MKWPVKKIQEVASIHTGKTPSTSDASNFEGDIPFATPSDLNGVIVVTNRHVSLNGSKFLTLVRAGASLVGCIGDVGKIGFATVPMTFNQQINAVVWNQKLVDDKYGFFVLRFLSNVIKQKAVSAVVPILNKTNFSKIEIPLPPLAEQQRIAALLDTADRILKQRESAIAKLDQLAQSVFVDMFGDLVSNSNSWPVVKLNDACLIKAQYGAGLSAVEFNSSLPRYVRITDINEDGSLNEKVVSPSGSKSDWEDYFLNDGDILFARSGATVGKAYLHSNQIHQCIYAGYLIRFIPNKKLMTSEFLYALTKSSFYKNWVKAKQNVVAQPNINANQYGNELVFPLPPIALQEEFTNFYNKIKSYKEIEIMASIKHKQLQSSLQHQSFAVN